MFKFFKTPEEKREAALRSRVTYLKGNHVLNVIIFLASLPVAVMFFPVAPIPAIIGVLILLGMGSGNKKRLQQAEFDLEDYLERVKTSTPK